MHNVINRAHFAMNETFSSRLLSKTTKKDCVLVMYAFETMKNYLCTFERKYYIYNKTNIKIFLNI